MPTHIVDFIPTVKPTFRSVKKRFRCRLQNWERRTNRSGKKRQKAFYCFHFLSVDGGTILAVKIANSSIQKAKFDGLSDAQQRNILLSTPSLERGPAVIR